MKFIIALLAACQAVTALAAPFDGYNQPTVATYKLKVVTTASEGSDINGKFLSPNKSNENLLGVYNRRPYEAVITAGSIPNTYSLHEYPRDNLYNELSLVGNPGLKEIRNLDNAPATDPLPPNTISFAQWTISPPISKVPTQRFLGFKDDTKSEWVAFPRGNGEWDIKWYDGSVIVTANFLKVKIEVVKV